MDELIIVILYVLAVLALLISTTAIYGALIERFPVKLLYYHYFLRKPIVWTIFGGSVTWILWYNIQMDVFPTWSVLPLLLMGLALVLSYKMHQENVFKAVDYPKMAEDITELPLEDDMQIAVVEYAGECKAYPLNYVIHHHVINDQFGDRIVSLTYCAMCRSIIPFDVTEIGPLFVASFKNANMVVADRQTKTFFQQATFESIIGKLHPMELEMISFQILPWSEVKQLDPIPQVVYVEGNDLRDFKLPIPGIWDKIMTSEVTPGLNAKNRDKTFPSRTHVIGIIDPNVKFQVVYLKEEIMDKRLVENEELDIFLIGIKDVVLCFKNSLKGKPLSMNLESNNILHDINSDTTWNLQGKHLSGSLKADLILVTTSDEYWFSWKKFHPGSKLIRL